MLRDPLIEDLDRSRPVEEVLLEIARLQLLTLELLLSSRGLECLGCQLAEGLSEHFGVSTSGSALAACKGKVGQVRLGDSRCDAASLVGKVVVVHQIPLVAPAFQLRGHEVLKELPP